MATLEGTGRSFEIIFVNDGSRDNSWTALNNLRDRFPDSLTVIDLMKNFGQHNAIMCGLRESQGSIVITLDDDLQNPPEEIPKLLHKLEEEELDLVYGVYKAKQHAFLRNLGSELTQKFYRTVFGLTNGVSAFRAIRRDLVNCISGYDLNFVYLDGLFAWNTDRIDQTEVMHDIRPEGRSGYSLRRLVTLAINLFANFSIVPLQLVSLFGFLAAALGFTAGFYYAYMRLLNDISVPGFASLMIAILAVGGIQMLSIGIIGEYLGRLHINANRKPQYVHRRRRPRRAPHDIG